VSFPYHALRAKRDTCCQIERNVAPTGAVLGCDQPSSCSGLWSRLKMGKPPGPPDTFILPRSLSSRCRLVIRNFTVSHLCPSAMSTIDEAQSRFMNILHLLTYKSISLRTQMKRLFRSCWRTERKMWTIREIGQSPERLGRSFRYAYLCNGNSA
jgi:hypothetical protein